MPNSTSTKWWQKIDGFLLLIIAAALTATLFPVRGSEVEIVSWTSKVTVGALFFLYGVRLERSEAIAGLKNWKLHLVILGVGFGVFPLLGLLLSVTQPLLGPELYRGLLWVCLVPGTVQSAINFTSIAKGNVAGAIVSSSLSNLLGVFITPLLAMALMSTTGLQISAASILDIAAQVLAPFVLGQLVRKWVYGFVSRHPKLKYFDQATVALVVYSAFSSGMRDGIWQRTSIGGITVIILINLALLGLMLAFTWTLAAKLHFNRADQIAIQFCATKKSLATGVPMAAVLFPAGAVGLIVLPLMIFHQAQLMACGSMASRYGRKSEEWHQQEN